jgi:hypothetical protein
MGSGEPSMLLDAISSLAERFTESVERYSPQCQADIAPLLRFIDMARTMNKG